MSPNGKIYMLTGMSFLVGTSQFALVGILAKVAASVGVSIAAAGQLITIFALSNAVGTPLVIWATAKMDRRNQLLLALVLILLGCGLIAGPGFGFLVGAYGVLGVGAGVFIAYSMMYTYITPFLTQVVSVGPGQISIVLLALGIASLIGSKLGGVLSDRIGTRRTLLGDLVVHGGVFTDEQMTAAIIDRLAHHGHLIVFEGESYRMKHALMKER